MNNSFMIERLMKQKDEIDNIIRNYQNQQNQQTPINNYITTGQQPTKDYIEWRVLNENEEVDNLYVPNKTLFVSDNLMILKGVDGSLEKWEVKKIYPVDKKDEKISELENEIRKLKEMINNEPTKSNVTIRELEQSDEFIDVNVEPKPKTNGKSVSKKEQSRTSRNDSTIL